MEENTEGGAVAGLVSSKTLCMPLPTLPAPAKATQALFSPRCEVFLSV